MPPRPVHQVVTNHYRDMNWLFMVILYHLTSYLTTCNFPQKKGFLNTYTHDLVDPSTVSSNCFISHMQSHEKPHKQINHIAVVFLGKLSHLTDFHLII